MLLPRSEGVRLVMQSSRQAAVVQADQRQRSKTYYWKDRTCGEGVALKDSRCQQQRYAGDV